MVARLLLGAFVALVASILVGVWLDNSEPLFKIDELHDLAKRAVG